MGQHVLWTPPYGRRVIPVEHVERLLGAGIIKHLGEEPSEPSPDWDFFMEEVANGNVLYRFGEGFDHADYTLAVDTLTREAARAKQERVLDALRASTPPEVQ